MINPGLLTASISSADHFGMSADCPVCFSIVVTPSFGWLLKGAFPLVATEGTRLGAPPHTVGGNEEEHSKRSVELCGWAVVYDEAQRGMLTNLKQQQLL